MWCWISAVLLLTTCLLVGEGRFQIRLTQDVDGAQQRANLGEGGVQALSRIRNAMLVEIGSAAAQGAIGGDVRVWDEVWAREALDQQVEGLGAVDIDGVVKGAGLGGLDEAVNVECALLILNALR